MKLYKILLLPVSILYGVIVAIRNLLFDYGIFPTKGFKTTVISVVNLSTGGTGKTPHVEYLINLLIHKYQLAVLSRGYGRKNTGFIVADENKSAVEIGDEPLQIKKKFRDVIVAVCNSRVKGINELLKLHPEINIIILDDAFQHRYVNPAISILLTDYSLLYANDFVLPSGNLREFQSGASRADVIIVSKTPLLFSPLDRRFLINKLNPKPYQKIFFSYTSYGNLVSLNKTEEIPFPKEYYFEKNYSILLLTGIANATNIAYYLKNQVENMRHLSYPDHYKYTHNDLKQITNSFDTISDSNKIIITTEKDAMRLLSIELKELVDKLPVFYLPMEIRFHDQDAENFNQFITSYVKQN